MSALDNLITLERDARQYGFDWPKVDMVIDQAVDECREVKEAIDQDEGQDRIQEEIGDVLHTAISLCLYQGFDVEETLTKAVEKFGGRMTTLKAIAKQKGFEHLRGQSMPFMLELWDQAKKARYDEPCDHVDDVNH